MHGAKSRKIPASRPELPMWWKSLHCRPDMIKDDQGYGPTFQAISPAASLQLAQSLLKLPHMGRIGLGSVWKTGAGKPRHAFSNTRSSGRDFAACRRPSDTCSARWCQRQQYKGVSTSARFCKRRLMNIVGFGKMVALRDSQKLPGQDSRSLVSRTMHALLGSRVQLR